MPNDPTDKPRQSIEPAPEEGCDDRHTVLTPEDFDAFVAALDEPNDPRFDEFMANPPKWGQEELF